MESKIIGLFPTGFVEYKLQFTDQEIQNMIDSVQWMNHKQGYEEFPIYQISKQDLQNQESFKKLADTVIKCGLNYCEKIGYKPENLYITSMWMNKFSNSQSIGPHTHTNSLLSGVYYLNSNPEQGGTEFYNPISKMRNSISVTRDGNSPFLTDRVASSAEPNKMVIWPSYVEHRSEKNITNKIRYTLSFNLLPTKLGNQEHFNYAEIK
jgi:uncharacterized protein (TIGR02466 family)